MSRIDDSLAQIESITDKTERALQLAGLLSTLFKIKGVALIVTGQLAFDSYANAASDKVELELGPLSGKLTPRLMLEIMRGQLGSKGSIYHWKVAGLAVRFLTEIGIAHPELCRDFMTDHGVVKLIPAEEITAECILASVFPTPDFEAQTRARLLLINGLTDAFHMNWTVLHTLCHRPEYRVGEELAKMRLAAKKDVDAIGGAADRVGSGSELGVQEDHSPIPPPPDQIPADSPVENPRPRRASLVDLDGLY